MSAYYSSFMLIYSGEVKLCAKAVTGQKAKL